MTKHDRHMIAGLLLLIVPSFIILLCLFIDTLHINQLDLRWDGWPPLTPTETIFNLFFSIGFWGWLPALVAGIVAIRARNK